MGTMSAQPDGVRVLITGGTSGLGVAMAAALLDAGAALASPAATPLALRPLRGTWAGAPSVSAWT